MLKLLGMNRIDGLISWLTAALVLFWEVEAGLLVGVAASIVWLLANHRQPYLAELGLIPDTERFKNINHAQTQTLEHCLFVRIDESITFINASVLEQSLLAKVADHKGLSNLIIVASGIHNIDATGAHMLTRFSQEMATAGLNLYLTDVKVPLAKQFANFKLFADNPDGIGYSSIDLYRKLAAEQQD